MIIQDEQKLDNPVWYSLSENHQSFVIEYDNIKFYHPDYCPFGSFSQPENISKGISEYSGLCENFFVVGEKPVLPNSVKLKNELVCQQMIIYNKIDVDKKEKIMQLGKEQADQLSELINLIQPGYYKQKTFLLGNYYGIFKDNELIAVAGERMKMNKYTEISAVITRPGHTGNGYAKQLLSYVVDHIIGEKKIPYLHVAQTNTAAIHLYEKLGFQMRSKMSFWNIIK